MNGSTHENQKICVSQECNGVGKIKGIANKSQGLDYRAQWLFSNPKSVGGYIDHPQSSII